MKESHSSCLFEDGFPIVILGPSDHPLIFKIGLWNKSSYRGSVSRFQPILEGGVLIHAIFLNISPLFLVLSHEKDAPYAWGDNIDSMDLGFSSSSAQ